MFEKKASDGRGGQDLRLAAKLAPLVTRPFYNFFTSSDEPLAVPPPPPPKDNTFSNFFKSIPINFRINPKTLMTGHPEELNESEIMRDAWTRTPVPYSHINLLSSIDKRLV